MVKASEDSGRLSPAAPQNVPITRSRHVDLKASEDALPILLIDVGLAPRANPKRLRSLYPGCPMSLIPPLGL